MGGKTPVDNMSERGIVLGFPSREIPRPTRTTASRIDIVFGRTQELFGALLSAFRIPGAVRDVSLKDALTGQEVNIRVGTLFTRISINGRDYYFRRLTGKFDGTGMGCG